ncbi:MAG: hypothetical protein QNL62_14045 [Gammaproteobacteria bacterium]|nr:hypothetical protein [Gammaproteobacteria bacterium]
MPVSNNKGSASPEKIFLWALTFSAIIAGVYLRLKGLDKAPFTIDEYYIAASVQNILERGVPEFGCGGYYTRGLFYQYILAPLFACGSNDELYARLVTVASNLLTAPALYLLAKQISGKTVAYAAIALFFLSVWEIEFSRFARMYSPFQMIFIWYLYFLHKWALLNSEKAKKWCYSLSLLSIFVYEGGVFLILLNFLPPFINHKHFRKSSIAISAAILAIAYTYLTTNFRFPGSETITHTTDSFLILPPIMASTLRFGSLWFILYLILSFIIIFTGIKLITKLHTDQNEASVVYKAILIASLSIFALLNAYTLIACTVILSLTLNWVTLKDIINRKYLPVLFSILLMLGFWIAYGLFTDNWINAIDPEKQASVKQLFIALFKYPDIFGKVIHAFFQTMPLFTISSALILSIGAIDVAYSNKEKRESFFFLLTALIILIILVSMLRQPYISTRYFFFLYPIIILLVSLSIYNLLNRFIPSFQSIIIVPTILYMALSEDYLLHHYTNIDSDEITYRMSYNEEMTNHLYARWDYRSPAKFINDNSSSDDIIITATYAAPYYLDRLDYFYHDHGRDNLSNSIGCNGKKSLWTNAELITLPDELLSIINSTDKTVWLLAISKQYKWVTPIEAKIDANYSQNITYKSIDGNINVYKFP